MVDASCTSLGIRRQDIACVAFSAGPGSFTGVRLGAAVAQGIASGTDAEIYRAPTSLCMGEGLRRTGLVREEFTVQRTSRRDLVYEARLHHDGTQCVFVVTDRLVKRDELDDEYPRFHDSQVPLSAFDVLLLAAQRRDEWQSPVNALPIYVEGDHPWQPTH